MVIYRAGADNPIRSNFLQKHQSSVSLVICCKFLQLNDLVTVFPIQIHWRPCRKIGQGQPMVIIYIISIELDSPMVHAKFQDHQPLGSGEEDLLSFLPYMGVDHIYKL